MFLRGIICVATIHGAIILGDVIIRRTIIQQTVIYGAIVPTAAFAYLRPDLKSNQGIIEKKYGRIGFWQSQKRLKLGVQGDAW